VKRWPSGEERKTARPVRRRSWRGAWGVPASAMRPGLQAGTGLWFFRAGVASHRDGGTRVKPVIGAARLIMPRQRPGGSTFGEPDCLRSARPRWEGCLPGQVAKGQAPGSSTRRIRQSPRGVEKTPCLARRTGRVALWLWSRRAEAGMGRLNPRPVARAYNLNGSQCQENKPIKAHSRSARNSPAHRRRSSPEAQADNSSA
jgi:hypothetical protein